MLQVNSQSTIKIQNHSIFANFCSKTAHFSNRSFIDSPKSKSFVCIKCGNSIDPPYTTGNDFVYEDDFSRNAADYIANSGQTDEEGNRLVANTESNGRFHTDWLNLMYPRLKLARDLLSADGVIFISIDDNEVDNLKKICDEIFGECNFKTVFSKVTKRGGKSSSEVAKNHDFLLMYTKNSDLADLKDVAHIDAGYCKKDEYFEIRGYYKANQTLDYDWQTEHI